MGRPQLGAKCTCTGCNERFYDLNRLPATCPKCGAVQPPVVAPPPRMVRPLSMRSRPFQAPAPIEAEEPEAVAATAEDEEEDDEDDAIDPDIDDDVGVEPIGKHDPE